MSETEIDPADNLMLDTWLPDKEIAGSYMKPLLDEGILKVTRDHITLMNLTIPRERVVFFHVALTQLRSPTAMFPVVQGRNGFTIEAVKVAHGNYVSDGYKITSNADDHGAILLTKSLAWELWEVVAFFIPKLEAPVDNPLEKTTRGFDAFSSSGVESEWSDDDYFEDDEVESADNNDYAIQDNFGGEMDPNETLATSVESE